MATLPGYRKSRRHRLQRAPCLGARQQQDVVGGTQLAERVPEHYPKAQASDEPADLPDKCTKEVRARQQTRDNHAHGTVLLNAAQETAPHRTTQLLEVIDCEHYSTCIKLFRVTAIVLKFVSNLKARRDKSRSAPVELSSEEISEARKTWIREIQRHIKQQATLTQQLGLFKDEDDILRC